MEQITYTEILQEDEIYNHKLSDFKTPVNQYFSGYFEDLRYYNFSKYKKDLMKEFTLKVELPSLHKKYLKMIKSTNSVSVHIRRTDHGSLGFVPLQYYIDSINYMKQHVENPHFFIFSDDLDFFRKNIKIEGNYTLIEGTNTSNPIFDFELMRNCKHNIIANSTFSWWAALLNAFKKKIVTAPKLWRSDKPSDYIIPEDYIVF
ncbi:alpha-1,2-fucosyltransferase [Histomonas meleagridis]|uniref:alpha-1,2-fucosyltransferase n=1 Tax=Histomonas meleagridis TaxID=135588 RepID=UPI0035598FD7|nr:alpha-1,2-fucosyltransferase [Histomonas meleagridis]KAH0803504.1 alpha-1,2-fucosyltransferase [Histomonas meleagridis]